MLTVADELAPHAGFPEAISTFRDAGGIVDPNRGDEIYRLAAPILRILPKLSCFLRSFIPPDAVAVARTMATNP